VTSPLAGLPKSIEKPANRKPDEREVHRIGAPPSPPPWASEHRQGVPYTGTRGVWDPAIYLNL
jgi:hypothetical protein